MTVSAPPPPALPPLAARLRERIEDRSARVGIIGMGYVGLPLSLAFAAKGFEVRAFDVDRSKVDSLNAARSYIKHMNTEALSQAVREGRYRASDDFSGLADVDAIAICVPTPLTPQREPEMSFVRRTAEAVARSLREGQLVMLESTTYPGTTDGLMREILDGSGLALGEQYFLAYSPEREDPGRRSHQTATIPKLVGGAEPVSGVLAEALYRQVIERVVRVSSARIAEAAKLTENIFRAVNIALVNELKVVYDRMGIDIWEVLDAAETKPFGFMRFNPGPGLGGHCIPLDPFYLSWKAREYGPPPKFIELAGEVNVEMPEYVVNKIVEALNEQGKAVRGSSVLLLGVAYKPDVDDCRESPAFPIFTRLEALGAEVQYHDGYVAEIPRLRAFPGLEGRQSVDLDDETLRTADAVVVITDHNDVDYQRVAEVAQLVVDTRGRVDRAEGAVRRA